MTNDELNAWLVRPGARDLIEHAAAMREDQQKMEDALWGCMEFLPEWKQYEIRTFLETEVRTFLKD